MVGAAHRNIYQYFRCTCLPPGRLHLEIIRHYEFLLSLMNLKRFQHLNELESLILNPLNTIRKLNSRKIR